VALSNTRKRKFRRWATRGVPQRAPLSEKLAFGAFQANKAKRERKKLGLGKKSPDRRIVTVNTIGWVTEFETSERLEILHDMQWRAGLSKQANNFRKRRRCLVVFVRLLLELPHEAQFYSGSEDDSDDEYQRRWVGSAEGHDYESMNTSFSELCDHILKKLGNYTNLDGSINLDGKLVKVGFYCLRTKRRAKRKGAERIK
jgi:hypothetical protein